MKVKILAFVLLVDVRGVQVETAELFEDFPEVTRRKLRVDCIVLFGLMSTALTDVASSFDHSAGNQSVRNASLGTIRIPTLGIDRKVVGFLCTVYKDSTCKTAVCV